VRFSSRPGAQLKRPRLSAFPGSPRFEVAAGPAQALKIRFIDAAFREREGVISDHRQRGRERRGNCAQTPAAAVPDWPCRVNVQERDRWADARKSIVLAKCRLSPTWLASDPSGSRRWMDMPGR